MSSSLKNTPNAKPPNRLYSFLVLLLATVVACVSIEAVRYSNAKVTAERRAENLIESETSDVATQAENPWRRAARQQKAQEPIVFPEEPSITDEKVWTWLSMGFVLGIVGLLPTKASREPDDEARKARDAKGIAESANLPLLGSVLPGDHPPAIGANRAAAIRWLVRALTLAEGIICFALVVAIAGCLFSSGVAQEFIEHPFSAYVHCVEWLVDSVASYFVPPPSV